MLYQYIFLIITPFTSTPKTLSPGCGAALGNGPIEQKQLIHAESFFIHARPRPQYPIGLNPTRKFALYLPPHRGAKRENGILPNIQGPGATLITTTPVSHDWEWLAFYCCVDERDENPFSQSRSPHFSPALLFHVREDTKAASFNNWSEHLWVFSVATVGIWYCNLCFIGWMPLLSCDKRGWNWRICPVLYEFPFGFKCPLNLLERVHDWEKRIHLSRQQLAEAD